MRIFYNYIPVVEEILVKRLEDYFRDNVLWDNLYSKFPLTISNEYPWVPYMTATGVDFSKASKNLFPSITVVNSQDNKSPQLFANMKTETLEKDDLAALISQSESEGYSIAPEALAAIQTHFDTNDFLYGLNIIHQRRDTINIDITTDDRSVIKDRIFSYIELYLSGDGAINLKKDLDIEIITTEVSGGRSGIYNVDFGRTLRGATIQFPVDYKITQCVYDTEASLITDIKIDHTVI